MRIELQSIETVKKMLTTFKNEPKEVVIDSLMIVLGQLFCIPSIRDLIQYKYSDMDFLIMFTAIKTILMTHYDNIYKCIMNYTTYLYENTNENTNDKRYKEMIAMISDCLNDYTNIFKMWYSVKEIEAINKVLRKKSAKFKPTLTISVNPLKVYKINVECNYEWSIISTNLIDIIRFMLNVKNAKKCISLIITFASTLDDFATIRTHHHYKEELIQRGTNNITIASRMVVNAKNPGKTPYFLPFKVDVQDTTQTHDLLTTFNYYKSRVEEGIERSYDNTNFPMFVFLLSAMWHTTNTDMKNMSKIGFYHIDQMYKIFCCALNNSKSIESFVRSTVTII